MQALSEGRHDDVVKDGLLTRNAKEVKEHEEEEAARLKEEKEWEEEFDEMDDEDFEGSDDGLVDEEE